MERSPQIECDSQLHKSEPENRVTNVPLGGEGGEASPVSGRREESSSPVHKPPRPTSPGQIVQQVKANDKLQALHPTAANRRSLSFI